MSRDLHYVNAGAHIKFISVYAFLFQLFEENNLSHNIEQADLSLLGLFVYYA